MELQELKLKVKVLAAKYAEDAVAYRRHLHTIPETGFEEFKTAEFIKNKLVEFNIPFVSRIATTGILGTISNSKGSKVIALRSDIDALPIAEQNDISYKSTHAGIMHACGHDVHMACLLGTARILNELKNEFSGTIKIIFQPSEEKFPGGAIKMIEAGVLENPHVDHVIGMHVLPTLAAGKIGFKPGKYMASTDELYITVTGKGGHAATPELVINPLIVASEILIAFDAFFKDKSLDENPFVLTFGRITGDGRTNIVPDAVKIEGTFRAYNEQWRWQAHEHLQRIGDEIAKKYNANFELTIAAGYPFLENDALLTSRLQNAGMELLGDNNVVSLDMRLTAEDFAYFAAVRPSCFYRLGTNPVNNTTIMNLHTNTFNIDESAIETGIATMVWLTLNEMICQPG